MTTLTEILHDPEVYYPGNFDTPERAVALLTGLCQDAAIEIERLERGASMAEHTIRQLVTALEGSGTKMRSDQWYVEIEAIAAGKHYLNSRSNT